MDYIITGGGAVHVRLPGWLTRSLDLRNSSHLICYKDLRIMQGPARASAHNTVAQTII